MTSAAAARERGSTEPSSLTRPLKPSSSEPPPPDTQSSDVDGPADSTATKQLEAKASTESAPSEAAALPQVLKIVGSIVAPTTLLTALMFYFGRQHASGWFRYLDVQSTVLNLPAQDYLLRSVDGLIVPMIVVAGATLLALWAHQLLFKILPARIRRIVLWALTPSTGIAGLFLISLAIVDLLTGALFQTFLEGRGLSLSIGVLLLTYAARLLRLLVRERRPGEVPERPLSAMAVVEWGAVFILVSVGLFWAAGSYAIGVGTGRAQQIETSLQRFPDVVVYSEKSLNLKVPGVREVKCQNPDAAYRFGYEGLKLVPQSGNQYLFLPSGWTHAKGPAILLPHSETLRFEFSPPGQRNATC